MSLDVYLYASKSCPNCGFELDTENEVYNSNITHNLGKMAEAAGIYMELWRPEEIEITRAHQLIAPLCKGFDKMASDPEYYHQFDSPNGWGRYVHFIPWLKAYIDACRENPGAFVRVSR